MRYASLARESEGKNSELLKNALEKEDMKANAALYILLRAVDRFHATYSRFPGSFDRCMLSMPSFHLPQLQLTWLDPAQVDRLVADLKLKLIVLTILAFYISE